MRTALVISAAAGIAAVVLAYAAKRASVESQRHVLPIFFAVEPYDGPYEFETNFASESEVVRRWWDRNLADSKWTDLDWPDVHDGQRIS